MSPLISVIVPIYKVEPYLQRCLDSVVNQTYTNLEIILIDDGSPDNCPQICDDYAAKDNRIVVIHKENGGLSDARNVGLDICKGEYISFIDSDDWVADIYIESMVKAILDNNADMAVVNFKRSPYALNFYPPSLICTKTEILEHIQAVEKLWSSEETIFVTAWGKLVKASLYKNIRFPKGFVHEDVYTSYKLLYFSQKTIFLDAPLYYYFQREGSIMSEAKPDSLRLLKAKVERYLFFKSHKEIKIMAFSLPSLCWDLLFAYSKISKGGLVIGFSSATEVLSIYQEAVKDYTCYMGWTFWKVIFIFFAKFPKTYSLYQMISPIKIRKT